MHGLFKRMLFLHSCSAKQIDDNSHFGRTTLSMLRRNCHMLVDRYITFAIVFSSELTVTSHLSQGRTLQRFTCIMHVVLEEGNHFHHEKLSGEYYT